MCIALQQAQLATSPAGPSMSQPMGGGYYGSVALPPPYSPARQASLGSPTTNSAGAPHAPYASSRAGAGEPRSTSHHCPADAGWLRLGFLWHLNPCAHAHPLACIVAGSVSHPGIAVEQCLQEQPRMGGCHLTLPTQTQNLRLRCCPINAFISVGLPGGGSQPLMVRVGSETHMIPQSPPLHGSYGGMGLPRPASEAYLPGMQGMRSQAVFLEAERQGEAALRRARSQLAMVSEGAPSYQPDASDMQVRCCSCMGRWSFQHICTF